MVEESVKKHIDPLQKRCTDQINQLQSKCEDLERKLAKCGKNEHLHIVIHKLDFRENENVKHMVDSLLNDGLKLGQVSVSNAVRKSAPQQGGRPGVVIATSKSV